MADNSGDSLVAFIFGGLVGAAAGILLAPRSGAETRERVKDWLEENREKTRELYEENKDKLRHKKDQISSAWEAGKQAYREADES